MLDKRLENGERLEPESYIFRGDDNNSQIHRKRAFQKGVWRVMKKAGFPHRTYTLRSYFDTALMNSSINHNYQQFLMGHNGDIEMIYTLRKNFPQEQIDEIRRKYKDVIEPWLCRNHRF